LSRPLLAFALFAAVVTITPGVDTMLVLRASALSGRRAGLGAVAGIVTGCLVWAALSALGVAAVLTASRVAFEILRAAGVVYLLYLGVRALLGSRARRDGGGAEPVPHSTPGWRTGLTTNLLNPKVGAFYLSVMPAFLPAGLSPLAGGLLLGGVHAVEGAVWLTALVYAVGRARALFERPRVQRTLQRLSGLVFIGFGVRLALERAPA
jgi:threonine/homoserine/homoserine lactone efflux protein